MQYFTALLNYCMLIPVRSADGGPARGEALMAGVVLLPEEGPERPQPVRRRAVTALGRLQLEVAAEVAQVAAAEKVKQYQDALRQARGQVYAEQEAARKKLLDERAVQLKEARAKAAGEVSAAKDRVARELAAASRDVEATVAELSAEIARRILQPPPRPGRGGTPAREAR